MHLFVWVIKIQHLEKLWGGLLKHEFLWFILFASMTFGRKSNFVHICGYHKVLFLFLFLWVLFFVGLFVLNFFLFGGIFPPDLRDVEIFSIIKSVVCQVSIDFGRRISYGTKYMAIRGYTNKCSLGSMGWATICFVCGHFIHVHLRRKKQFQKVVLGHFIKVVRLTGSHHRKITVLLVGPQKWWLYYYCVHL